MDKAKEMTRISLDLPAKIHKRLKTLAAVRETSMREIIIKAIELHLQNMKGKDSKSKMAEEFFDKIGL